jgi:hypothetical protein
MKLVNILKEIKVSTPGLVGALQTYKSQIDFTDDLKEAAELALQGAKLVLPIFEKLVPEDKTARKAIESTQAYLLNPTTENKKAITQVNINILEYPEAAIHARSAIYMAVWAAANSEALGDLPDNKYAKTSIKYAISAAQKNQTPQLHEIKVNNPNTKEKQLYAKILSMYPEAKLQLNWSSTWLGDGYSVIYLFSNSGPQSINVNSIIIDPQGVYTAYLGNDVAGRRFKIVDNLIKYIKNNPVENHMNEIKISSPNKTFQVTEKGQNFYDKYDELFDILWFFSVDLDIWNLDDPGDLVVASDFHRYVREDIIKNKGNNSLEDVLKKSDNYGEEPEDIKEHLKSFLSLGLITPFNL